MTAPDDVRATIRVRGRVQGVWYRQSTKQRATALGLRGWVRNEGDGSVRAVAEGPKDRVERLVQWCHEGPPAARVDSVEVTWDAAAGDLVGFRVTH